MMLRQWSVSFAACGLPFAVWLTACDEPLTPPQLINRTRVVAARVEVEGDPSRATPSPSERVALRVLAVDPQLDTLFTWQFRACVSVPNAVGLPNCMSAPFAVNRQEAPGTGEPMWDFDIPAEGLLRDAPGLLVEGVVCSRGLPREDLTGCSGGGADGDRVSIPIALEQRAPNRNPSLADDVVTLDGNDWGVPNALDTSSCDAGSSLPSVRGGSGEHAIRLTLQGGDRDRSPSEEPTTGGEGLWETLRVDYYATAGELSVVSSFLEADDQNEFATLSVAWRAPETPPPAAQLVRVVFVSRDLRGGSDWTVRALCLVP